MIIDVISLILKAISFVGICILIREIYKEKRGEKNE